MNKSQKSVEKIRRVLPVIMVLCGMSAAFSSVAAAQHGQHDGGGAFFAGVVLAALASRVWQEGGVFRFFRSGMALVGVTAVFWTLAVAMVTVRV